MEGQNNHFNNNSSKTINEDQAKNVFLTSIKENKDFDKLIGLIDSINDKKFFELVGQFIAPSQLVAFLSLGKKIDLTKIYSIIIGMTTGNFIKTIFLSDAKELETLKENLLQAPVLHHITLYSNNLNELTDSFFSKYQNIVNEINNLNIPNEEEKEIIAIENTIKSSSFQINETIENLQKILNIVWGASRTDLIEKIGQQKEILDKLFKGEFSNGEFLSENSLQLLLWNKVFSLFTELEKKGEFHSIPSIEGIECFSIWYPQDFKEIGLLSTNATQDNFEEVKHTVWENLKKLDLHSIQDLVDKKIYSKNTLKKFIENRSF